MRPKVVNLKVSRILRKRSELPCAPSSEAEKEWTGLKLFGLDVAVDPSLPPDMLVFDGGTVTGRVAHNVPEFLRGPQDAPITMQTLENRRQQLLSYWDLNAADLRGGRQSPPEGPFYGIIDQAVVLRLARRFVPREFPPRPTELGTPDNNGYGDLTPDVARDERQREAPHARFIAENNRIARRRR